MIGDMLGDPSREPESPPGDRPLEGRTLVITRSEDRGDGLSRSLTALGARVISVASIRFAPPADPGPLQAAVSELGRFRWVIFTSATGVHFFLQAMRAQGLGPSALREKRLGAVGPATAAVLGGMNLRVERIAAASDARSLAGALVGPGSAEPLGAEDACLIPQSDIARPDLEEALRAAGVPVTAVTAYRTLTEDPSRAELFLKALEGDERIDGIAFASPSAVRSFLAMTHPHGEHAIREKPICVFSIGPTTTAAVRERGLQVAREAFPHTVEALVEAITEELTTPPPETGVIPDELL